MHIRVPRYEGRTSGRAPSFDGGREFDEARRGQGEQRHAHPLGAHTHVFGGEALRQRGCSSEDGLCRRVSPAQLSKDMKEGPTRHGSIRHQAQVEANENERQILARFTHVASIPAQMTLLAM